MKITKSHVCNHAPPLFAVFLLSVFCLFFICFSNNFFTNVLAIKDNQNIAVQEENGKNEKSAESAQKYVSLFGKLDTFCDYPKHPIGPFRIQLNDGKEYFYIRPHVYRIDSNYNTFFIVNEDKIKKLFNTDKQIAAMYRKGLLENKIRHKFNLYKTINNKEYVYTVDGIFTKDDHGKFSIQSTSEDVLLAFFPPLSSPRSFQITLENKMVYYYINNNIYQIDEPFGVFFPPKEEKIERLFSSNEGVSALYYQAKAEGRINDKIFHVKKIGGFEYAFSNKNKYKDIYLYRIACIIPEYEKEEKQENGKRTKNEEGRDAEEKENKEKDEVKEKEDGEKEWKACGILDSLDLSALFFPKGENVDTFIMSFLGKKYVYTNNRAYYFHTEYEALVPIENPETPLWFCTKNAAAFTYAMASMQNMLLDNLKINKIIQGKSYSLTVYPQPKFFVADKLIATDKFLVAGKEKNWVECNEEEIKTIRPYYFLEKNPFFFVRWETSPVEDYCFINNTFHVFDEKLNVFFPAENEEIIQWAESSNLDFAATYAQKVYEDRIITDNFTAETTIGIYNFTFNKTGMHMTQPPENEEHSILHRDKNISNNYEIYISPSNFLYSVFFPQIPLNEFIITLEDDLLYIYSNSTIYYAPKENFKGFFPVEKDYVKTLFSTERSTAVTFSNGLILDTVATTFSRSLTIANKTYAYRQDGLFEVHTEQKYITKHLSASVIEILTYEEIYEECKDEKMKENLLLLFFPHKPQYSFKILYRGNEYYYINRTVYNFDRRYKVLIKEKNEDVLNAFNGNNNDSQNNALAVTYSQGKFEGRVEDKFLIVKQINGRIFSYTNIGEEEEFYIKINYDENQWIRYTANIPDLRMSFFPREKPSGGFVLKLNVQNEEEENGNTQQQEEKEYYYVLGSPHVVVNNTFLPIKNKRILALFSDEFICATYSKGLDEGKVTNVFSVTKTINAQKYTYNQDGLFHEGENGKMTKYDDMHKEEKKEEKKKEEKKNETNAKNIFSFFFPYIPDSFALQHDFFPSFSALTNTYFYFDIQQRRVYFLPENSKLLKLIDEHFIQQHCGTYKMCALTYLKAKESKMLVEDASRVIEKNEEGFSYTYIDGRIQATKINENNAVKYDVFSRINYHLFFEEDSYPLDKNKGDEFNYFYIQLFIDKNTQRLCAEKKYNINIKEEEQNNNKNNNNDSNINEVKKVTYYYENGSLYLFCNNAFYTEKDEKTIQAFWPSKFEETYKSAQIDGRVYTANITAVKFTCMQKTYLYSKGTIIEGEKPYKIVKNDVIIREARSCLFKKHCYVTLL